MAVFASYFPNRARKRKIGRRKSALLNSNDLHVELHDLITFMRTTLFIFIYPYQLLRDLAKRDGVIFLDFEDTFSKGFWRKNNYSNV